MELGNGKWETAKFNERLQVTELGLGNSSTNADIWKVNYEFGEADFDGNVDASKNTGNIAKQTISFNGLSQPFVQTYSYDSLYRLTEAKEKAGSTQNWSQSFTYDRYGNRLGHNKEINGAPQSLAGNSHPDISTANNRFTSTAYDYDKNGNLILDADGRSFTFDGNNKQILITSGNVTVGQYFYDGDGKRIKKNRFDNAGNLTETTIFVYSLGKLIEERSTTPPQTANTKYLTEDHLGTPRIITDGTGEVVSRRDFMPFGEEVSSNVGARNTSGFKYEATADNVRQKFTGYQKDEETGLDFAQARMYENRHARFTAVDPLLASGNSANPQTFNRYVYVGNNPLVFIDPDGKKPVYMILRGKHRDDYVYLDTKWKSYKYFKAKYERQGYEVINGMIGKTLPRKGSTDFIKFTSKGFKVVNYMNPNNVAGKGPSKDYQTGFDMAGAVTSNLTFGYVTFGADENSKVFQRLGMAITLVQLKSLGALGVKGAVNLYTKAKSGDAAVELAETLNNLYKANPITCFRCTKTARESLEAFKKAGIDGEIVELIDKYKATDLLRADGEKIAETGFHQVVKVGDRYFDAMTGPNGATWDEYLKLLHPDTAKYIRRVPEGTISTPLN